MRKRSFITAALLVLMLGCGGGPGGSQGSELSRRVTKLEDDLHEVKRQLITQQQAMQILNERLKSMEASVDKISSRQ